MKILHIADTHLGFSAYRKSTTDGVNQREKDIYDSFTQVIDYALAEHVDLVLHAGDLFDTVRPTNRAITIALQQILRLSSAHIPIVIIAGNHEQPKLQETGHIFSIFDHLDNVYPVYHENYEKHHFTIGNKIICIHALPQINTLDVFQDQLDDITQDNNADMNILLFHGAVQGIKEFSMNEFNELFIPKHFLSSLFDYVALGHYHSYKKINNTAYYAGSTDALTFKDAGEKKGFIQLTKDHDVLQIEFKEIENRPVINIPTIFCDTLSVDEIMERIQCAIRTIEPVGKIFRITLKDISSHHYRNLDFRSIRQHAEGSIHYEIKVTFIDKDNTIDGQQEKIDSLAKEYERFIEKTDVKQQKMLLEKGLLYLERIEEELDTE